MEWHHVKVTFMELMKSVTNLHEGVEKGESAEWTNSAYLVREVHLVNVDPKVGRGNCANSCARVLSIMRRTLWCITSTYALGSPRFQFLVVIDPPTKTR